MGVVITVWGVVVDVASFWQRVNSLFLLSVIRDVVVPNYVVAEAAELVHAQKPR
jgi:hypothetical protein